MYYDEPIAFCDSFPESRRWLASYGTLKSRQRSSEGFHLFCKSTGLNPPQLMELRKTNQDKLYDLVDDFAVRKDLADELRRGAVSAVRSFFRKNRAELPSVVGAAVWNLPHKRPIRTPTKETLRIFIKGSMNLRDSSFVLFLATSCVAEGSVPHLTFRNVEPEWHEAHPNTTFEDWLEHFKLTPYPHIGIVGVVLSDGRTTLKGGGQGKYSGVEQHTFITPEAKSAMLQYLNWRLRRQKLTLDSPLFVTLKRQARGAPLEEAGIKEIFRRISRNNPEHISFSAHDMRRFVENALEEARIHPNRCRKIRGRKVRGEEAPYSRPAVDQLRNDYKSAVPYLEFMTPEPEQYEWKLAESRILLELERLPPQQRQIMLQKLKEGMPVKLQLMIESSPRILELMAEPSDGGLPPFMVKLEEKIRKARGEMKCR